MLEVKLESKKNIDPEVSEALSEMLRLVRSDGSPNINDLWMMLKDIDVIKLNIKNLGYELGRRLASDVLVDADIKAEPQYRGLASKATTQADIESQWFAYWCRELRCAPLYHRKLWEFAFLLQGLFDSQKLVAGARGLGFGCGEEPLASYFASKDMFPTVTDLHPAAVIGKGWAETGQHASAKDRAFYPDMVDRETFERRVSHEYVDMNAIPHHLDGQFDFCWSVCAMEHLGSIELGLTFVENSLRVLKPGGVAIHTTEFNYLDERRTIDNWPTVLFQKRHFDMLLERVERVGGRMKTPDYDTGNGVLDRFVDLPPYAIGEGLLKQQNFGDINQSAHLKMSIDGFPSTCFGIILEKIR